MAAKKLRAGVIGCGVGAAHGHAYMRADELYDLVAICDLKPEVFDRFYQRSGVARGAVKEYTDHREMLGKENLDVVSVATPDNYHVGPVVDAAEAGVKGIFCEKPIASSVRDADRMIEAVRRAGAKMSVDHSRSWYPTYSAVRRAIRAGEIGGLTRIVVHMGGRRAMLFRNGTHMVDTMEYFAESRPLWVIAAHERGFEEYGPEYKGEGGKDPMKDPGSTVIVEFENGVRGIFNSAKNTPAIYHVDVMGPGGRYYLTDTVATAYQTDQPEGEPREVAPPWTELPNTGAPPGISELGPTLIPAVREMYRMVVDGAESSSPPERARNTLEILYAALISQTRDSAKVHLPLPR